VRRPVGPLLAALPLVVALSVLGGARGLAIPPPEEVALYSDVCVNVAGDLLGSRIFLFKSHMQTSVVLEAAEGMSDWPDSVEAKIDGDRISFSAELPDGAIVAFDGTVDVEKMTGRYRDGRKNHAGADVFELRRMSASSKYPPC
jgi:hypothetical protein